MDKKNNKPCALEISFEELEVARFIANGWSCTDIAQTLHMSIHTVKNRMRKIIAKTDARNRTQAIAILAKLNII
ncbi:response regulator transcription factor [Spirochaetes bacterium]|uniref:Response regulator transcription factor n=1 Tax=Candidatus Scatousia excrementipullorum TaxID=2840936 RepID=A0A9D9DND5_9BACT|nr:response regulator transcription factor [Candidatus Scatousia excrementipullorum]